MREEKDISGCGIIGIMNEQGDAFSGEDAVVAICNMMERGNGLGAGFAGYGIYPELKDYWCFHLIYHHETARGATEEYMNARFKVAHHEPIPTKKIKTLRPPIPFLYRYFLEINDEMGSGDGREQDMILGCVMEINRHIEGAFVFSSGKNKGVKEIIDMGYDPSIVRDVIGRLHRNEYKRNQVPPGLKVTTKSFGYGRKFPIAQGYLPASK